jgi:dTMP kinase
MTALVPAAQTLLFAAARRQMLEELVEPALARGSDVVCERFHAATVAYQGAGLAVGEERVLELLYSWAGVPTPTLTLILDLAPEVACARRGDRDRFEALERDFHARVAASYRRYAKSAPDVVLVDASGSPDEVAQRVWEEVRRAGR